MTNLMCSNLKDVMYQRLRMLGMHSAKINYAEFTNITYKTLMIQIQYMIIPIVLKKNNL